MNEKAMSLPWLEGAPTEPGAYWYKSASEGLTLCRVYAGCGIPDSKTAELFAAFPGRRYAMQIPRECVSGGQWAGPIPEPKEPPAMRIVSACWTSSEQQSQLHLEFSRHVTPAEKDAIYKHISGINPKA